MRSARPTIVCPRVATLALVLRCSRTYITPTSLHCAASPTQAPKQSEYTPKYKTPNKPPETPEGCVIVISYIIYCKHAQPARSRVGVEARQSLGQLVGPSLYSYISKPHCRASLLNRSTISGVMPWLRRGASSSTSARSDSEAPRPSISARSRQSARSNPRRPRSDSAWMPATSCFFYLLPLSSSSPRR